MQEVQHKLGYHSGERMECLRNGEDPSGVEKSKIQVNKESEVRDLSDRMRMLNFILNEMVKQIFLEKRLIIQGLRKIESMFGVHGGLAQRPTGPGEVAESCCSKLSMEFECLQGLGVGRMRRKVC